MLQKNEIYDIKITDTNLLGSGFSRIDGMAVFIPDTVEGDTVSARITDTDKSFALAEMTELLEPSEFREASGCSYFGSCGGCCFCHVKYSHELKIKIKSVEAAFRRSGLGNVSASDIISCAPERYRNKAVFHFDENYNSGYYSKGTNHLIKDFRSCSLYPEIFDSIRIRLSTLLKESGIPSQNIRYLMIRGNSLGECAIMLGACNSQEVVAVLKEMRNQFPQIISASIGSGESPENSKYSVVYGEKYITESLLGVKFCIAPNAFFQINKNVAEKLFKLISNMLCPQKGDHIADLYCGTGAIGLCLAAQNPEIQVTGVEINSSAIECARKNALINDINNAQFYCEDSSKITELLEDKKINAAVIDPPRSGASKSMIKNLLKLSPEKIIYVSCNPSTLARDAKKLIENGYILRKIHAADMFPRCAHIESAALFERI